MKDLLRSRAMKGGGLAVGTLTFLSILIALQYVAVQNPKRWDVTNTGKHTLAPQSRQVLETFRDKGIQVELCAFYESKDQRGREEVQDLLDRYRDVWKNFSYTFYDPDKDRAVAIQNKVDAYPTIVLKAGDKIERLASSDEESVTNALMRLLRSETKKVYFLKGHGELDPADTGTQGFSVAKEQIEKQNYKTGDLILLQTPSVPDDATILVVAGPKTDLMENEIGAIEEFVHRGGSLFVMLNPFQASNFSQSLKKFGFETNDDIIVDKMSQALGGDYLMPVITTYAQFPITRNFTMASFFPQSRSIGVLSPAPPHIQAIELAKTSQVSWTINEQQLKSGVADFDEKTGKKGPLSVMSVSTVTVKKDNQKPGAESNTDSAPDKDVNNKDDQSDIPNKKGRVVVTGSSLFSANRFFKLQGNSDLFLNTVSWLAEDENLIAIRPKPQKSQPIVMTAGQSLVSFVVPVLLVPFIWIVAGIGVFVYRRKLARV